MTIRLLSLCCALLLVTPAYAEEATHKKVQAALDWELPENPCEKPRSLITATRTDPSAGGKAETDVDSYTIARYERKEKRWKACVEKYQDNLMKDFEELKGSAQYGLTKAQADTILGKMAALQEAYVKAEE